MPSQRSLFDEIESFLKKVHTTQSRLSGEKNSLIDKIQRSSLSSQDKNALIDNFVKAKQLPRKVLSGQEKDAFNQIKQSNSAPVPDSAPASAPASAPDSAPDSAPASTLTTNRLTLEEATKEIRKDRIKQEKLTLTRIMERIESSKDQTQEENKNKIQQILQELDMIERKIDDPTTDQDQIRSVITGAATQARSLDEKTQTKTTKDLEDKAQYDKNAERELSEIQKIIELNIRDMSEDQAALFTAIARRTQFVDTSDFQSRVEGIKSSTSEKLELVIKGSKGRSEEEKKFFIEQASEIAIASPDMEEFNNTLSEFTEEFPKIWKEISEFLSKIKTESVDVSGAKAREEEKKRRLGVITSVGRIKDASDVESAASTVSESFGYDDFEGERRSYAYERSTGLDQASRKKYDLMSSKLVKDKSITNQEFKERIDKLRSGFDYRIGSRGRGLIALARSEMKSTVQSEKDQKWDFVKSAISQRTSSMMSGTMTNKILMLIPGVGPIASVAFSIIKGGLGLVTSLASGIFSVISGTFQILTDVLGKIASAGLSFLKTTVKWGLISIGTLTLLYKTGLLEKIGPMFTNALRKFAPVITKMVNKILDSFSDTLEYLIEKIQGGIDGGFIRRFPTMILDFFRELFSGSPVKAFGNEMRRFGSNLAKIGSVLLDAIRELGIGFYEMWDKELWPKYLKPAWEHLRDKIPVLLDDLKKGILNWYENSDSGKMLKEYVVDPLSEIFENLAHAAEKAYYALLLIGAMSLLSNTAGAVRNIGGVVRTVGGAASRVGGSLSSAKSKVGGFFAGSNKAVQPVQPGKMAGVLFKGEIGPQVPPGYGVAPTRIRDARGRFIKNPAAPMAASAAPVAASTGRLSSGLLGRGLGGALGAGPGAALVGLGTGYFDWQDANERLETGEITETEASVQKSGSIGRGTGILAGAMAGAALGTMIPIPIVGTTVGLIAGALFGMLGDDVGEEVGEAVGTFLFETASDRMEKREKETMKEVKLLRDERRKVLSEKLSLEEMNTELDSNTNTLMQLNKAIVNETAANINGTNMTVDEMKKLRESLNARNEALKFSRETRTYTDYATDGPLPEKREVKSYYEMSLSINESLNLAREDVQNYREGMVNLMEQGLEDSEEYRSYNRKFLEATQKATELHFEYLRNELNVQAQSILEKESALKDMRSELAIAEERGAPEQEISDLRDQIRRTEEILSQKRTTLSSSIEKFNEASSPYDGEDGRLYVEKSPTNVEDFISNVGVESEILFGPNKIISDAERSMISEIRDKERGLGELKDDTEAQKLLEEFKNLREAIENGTMTEEDSTKKLIELQSSLDQNTKITEALSKAEQARMEAERKKEEEKRKKEMAEKVLRGESTGNEMMDAALIAKYGEEGAKAKMKGMGYGRRVGMGKLTGISSTDIAAVIDERVEGMRNPVEGPPASDGDIIQALMRDYGMTKEEAKSYLDKKGTKDEVEAAQREATRSSYMSSSEASDLAMGNIGPRDPSLQSPDDVVGVRGGLGQLGMQQQATTRRTQPAVTEAIDGAGRIVQAATPTPATSRSGIPEGISELANQLGETASLGTTSSPSVKTTQEASRDIPGLGMVTQSEAREMARKGQVKTQIWMGLIGDDEEEDTRRMKEMNFDDFDLQLNENKMTLQLNGRKHEFDVSNKIQMSNAGHVLKRLYDIVDNKKREKIKEIMGKLSQKLDEFGFSSEIDIHATPHVVGFSPLQTDDPNAIGTSRGVVDLLTTGSFDEQQQPTMNSRTDASYALFEELLEAPAAPATPATPAPTASPIAEASSSVAGGVSGSANSIATAATAPPVTSAAPASADSFVAAGTGTLGASASSEKQKDSEELRDAKFKRFVLTNLGLRPFTISGDSPLLSEDFKTKFKSEFGREAKDEDGRKFNQTKNAFFGKKEEKENTEVVSDGRTIGDISRSLDKVDEAVNESLGTNFTAISKSKEDGKKISEMMEDPHVRHAVANLAQTKIRLMELEGSEEIRGLDDFQMMDLQASYREKYGKMTVGELKKEKESLMKKYEELTSRDRTLILNFHENFVEQELSSVDEEIKSESSKTAPTTTPAPTAPTAPAASQITSASNDVSSDVLGSTDSMAIAATPPAPAAPAATKASSPSSGKYPSREEKERLALEVISGKVNGPWVPAFRSRFGRPPTAQESDMYQEMRESVSEEARTKMGSDSSPDTAKLFAQRKLWSGPRGSLDVGNSFESQKSRNDFKGMVDTLILATKKHDVMKGLKPSDEEELRSKYSKMSPEQLEQQLQVFRKDAKDYYDTVILPNENRLDEERTKIATDRLTVMNSSAPTAPPAVPSIASVSDGVTSNVSGSADSMAAAATPATPPAPASASPSGFVAAATGVPGTSASSESGGLMDYISRMNRHSQAAQRAGRRTEEMFKINDDGSIDVYFEQTSFSRSGQARDIVPDKLRLAIRGQIIELEKMGVDRTFLSEVSREIITGKDFEDFDETDGKRRMTYRMHIPKDALPTAPATPATPAAPIPSASSSVANGVSGSADSMAAAATPATPPAPASASPSGFVAAATGVPGTSASGSPDNKDSTVSEKFMEEINKLNDAIKRDPSRKEKEMFKMNKDGSMDVYFEEFLEGNPSDQFIDASAERFETRIKGVVQILNKKGVEIDQRDLAALSSKIERTRESGGTRLSYKLNIPKDALPTAPATPVVPAAPVVPAVPAPAAPITAASSSVANGVFGSADSMAAAATPATPPAPASETPATTIDEASNSVAGRVEKDQPISPTRTPELLIDANEIRSGSREVESGGSPQIIVSSTTNNTNQQNVTNNSSGGVGLVGPASTPNWLRGLNSIHTQPWALA